MNDEGRSEDLGRSVVRDLLNDRRWNFPSSYYASSPSVNRKPKENADKAIITDCLIATYWG